MSKGNPIHIRLSRLASAVIVVVAVVFLSSCLRRDPGAGLPEADSTREIIDEAGRHVRVPVRVQRIVSLAPNLTEIVYAVGAGGASGL